MATQIIAFLITLLANFIAGVAISLVMLLAMNGFSESHAFWGLAMFLACAVFLTIFVSTGAVFMVRYLSRRQYSAITACLLSVSGFSIVGIIAQMISGLVGIGITDYIQRTH
jgi:hypothetical protein